MRYALVRAEPAYLPLEGFARRCGLHPELVQRLVALGLLQARYGPDGRLWLPPTELAAAGRVQRLRAGLAINYAAVGVVADLLDRVAALEAALRRSRHHPGVRAGNSTGG